MKKNITRRNFIKVGGAVVSSASLGSMLWPLNSMALGGKPKPRVVVVGGGFGGATCAKYIKKFDENIDVTLIEVCVFVKKDIVVYRFCSFWLDKYAIFACRPVFVACGI